MERKRRIFTFEDFAVFLFFIPVFVIKILGLGASSRIALAVTAFSMLVSIIILLKKNVRRNEILLWLGVLLLGALSIFTSGKFSVFLSIYALFIMVNIQREKLIHVTFTIGLLGMIYLLLEGLQNNTVETRFVNGVWQYITKRSNMIYVVYFALVNLFMLKNKSLKFREIIIIEILGFFLYLYTGTRTGFYCLIAEGAALMALKYKAVQDSKVIKCLTILSPIIFTIINYWINYMYGSIPIFNIINSMLQNRLHYGKFFLDMYGLSIWGQRVETSFVEETYQVLDNAYLNLMIEYGLVILALWIWLNMCTFRYLFKQKRYTEIVVILGYLLYGFTESFIVVCFLNMSFFVYSDFLNRHYKVSAIP